MYKVMLVDDEYLDLEGLKRLVPWTELNMEVAAAVNSGRAAMQALSEDIHIVMTDIKMPIMTGLELAEKARRKYPRLKFVFISGYEDFQYAKKAISMNASGYVLKPVDDAELLKTLGAIREELDNERQRTAIESRYRQSLPILRNERMLQWLEGRADVREVAALWGNNAATGEPAAVVTVIEIDDIAWKLKSCPEEDRMDAIRKVTERILAVIEATSPSWYCTMQNHRFVWALPTPIHRQALEELIAHVKEHTGFSVTIGVGAEVSAPEELHDSYRKAEEALASKMFVGKGILIGADRMKGEVLRDISDLEQTFKRLFHAAATYDLLQIHDTINDLFIVVHHLENKIMVYHFALHVFSKLDHYLQSIKQNIYHILGMDFERLDELMQLETMEDIKTWLRKKLFIISEYLHEKRQRPNNLLVKELEQYVNNHLSRNLTLRDAANHFGFSPNHLGYIFKEETGENFSDFLIGRRLEKARGLLHDPRLKIYEIAEKVGYKSLTYFSRQFKEHFGVTPGDYRKQG